MKRPIDNNTQMCESMSTQLFSKTGDRAKSDHSFQSHDPTHIQPSEELSQESSKEVLTPDSHVCVDEPGVSHPGTNTSHFLLSSLTRKKTTVPTGCTEDSTKRTLKIKWRKEKPHRRMHHLSSLEPDLDLVFWQ